MPTARAPATSSSGRRRPSPRAGGDVEPLEHRAEDRLVRLRLAVEREVRIASTSMPWCATKTSRSRPVFESSRA
jgi:hypothetical protein